MINKAKMRYFIREELIYLSISLFFAVMTYVNYSFLKSLEMFFSIALFFQLVIVISNWKFIFKKDWLE